MKKLLIILLCLPMIGFGQNDCGKKPIYKGNKFANNYKNTNAYKTYEKKIKIWQDCISNDTTHSNYFATAKHIVLDLPILNHNANFSDFISGLKKRGFDVITSVGENNPCEVLYVKVKVKSAGSFSLNIFDCKNNLISKNKGICTIWHSGPCDSYIGELVFKCFEKNVIKKEPLFINVKEKLNSTDYEKDIRKYFDNNKIDKIEGIYSSTGLGGYNYKIAIRKSDFKYYATIIETDNRNYSVGDIKIILEEASVNTVFSVKYFMANLSEQNSVANFENDALISFKVATTSANGQAVAGDVVLLKLYPKLNSSKRTKTSNNGEWAGNGSGIIISKSGHIITNNHVIDDADDIEVEFILDNEVQKFNAEIVQVDKTNDLAVIKIVDVNFDGVKELPYNFKTRSSDVGTKVYAFGYPMALSIMGKEIKVTDGIISSKTGFDGNITTYQISAPIQGGNSGGPLFDDKGNFIGINSSGVNKKLADNVGYSIKTSYVLNLIDILPKSIDLPSNKKLASLPLTEQIKEISKYVVLVKVK